MVPFFREKGALLLLEPEQNPVGPLHDDEKTLGRALVGRSVHPFLLDSRAILEKKKGTPERMEEDYPASYFDDEEITQTDAWSVIDAYFDEKGLVRQQIDSFNEFVNLTLQDIIDDSGQETINAPNQFGLGQNSSRKLRARVEFNQVYVTKPSFVEKDGQTNNNITPHQCRLRNLTYSICLYVDVRIEEEEYDDDISEWRVIKKVRLLMTQRCLPWQYTAHLRRARGGGLASAVHQKRKTSGVDR